MDSYSVEDILSSESLKFEDIWDFISVPITGGCDIQGATGEPNGEATGEPNLAAKEPSSAERRKLQKRERRRENDRKRRETQKEALTSLENENKRLKAEVQTLQQRLQDASPDN